MMKNDFYNDEFEELLKEKADQFSMYPSKRVWHGIYNNLHPGRRWPSMAIGTLLITSLLLIGYLNTGDYRINSNVVNANNTPAEQQFPQHDDQQTPKYSNQVALKNRKAPADQYNNAFEDVIKIEDDFYVYTVVRNNRPENFFSDENTDAVSVAKTDTREFSNDKKETDILRQVDLYIKSNRVISDVQQFRKKSAASPQNESRQSSSKLKLPEHGIVASLKKATPALNTAATTSTPGNGNDLLAAAKQDVDVVKDTDSQTAINGLSDDDRAWIDNFALYNKNAPGKFKGRLSYQIYATPAVNYRKLTTESKGSAAPFALANVNEVISQKPGIGLEAGFSLAYKAANRLQLKAGVQFNYTNYNINADRTNHPIQTTILLVDPVTGYTYPASRTTTISNNFSGAALQPVTLHNRTYQLSLPVGFAYKLSSENNVDWFAGATIQPTYVFGGNAHLISSDLKTYVKDPSSIRSWNLNLGFETYMNFKLGGSYDLQVGPQVRYQVYSTYRKNVALIEKPYAIGLKLGLTKGF